MQRFNWTTVLIVSGFRNPTTLAIAEGVQRAATIMLNASITLVKVDIDPQTDYLQIMREVNLQTRGQGSSHFIYIQLHVQVLSMRLHNEFSSRLTIRVQSTEYG